ncbi:MAG: trimethylamine methyltransferase family protein [Chloroflexi bacterium]|nr:trimethylamine methyltransferase family protein [Chloroflexota bacterium]
MRVLRHFQIGFANTGKHYRTGVQRSEQAPYLLAMADALLGDRGRLRDRPIFSSICCTVSPLQHDGPMTEAHLDLAACGVPILAYPMPLAGATSPVTLAGAVLMNNVEFLSALALYQLASPGAPVIYGAGGATMDMRTGAYVAGGPEAGLIGIALVQMAHYYGLPVNAGGLATDARTVGYQSGYEGLLNGLLVALAGADEVFGIGMLESAQTLSLPHMVLDAELCRVIRYVRRGMAADDEHLMADLIARVGYGGHFLKEKETRDYFRRGEHFLPQMISHEAYEAWRAAGKSEEAVAAERARALLREHPVAPLAPEVARELEQIMADAAERLT